VRIAPRLEPGAKLFALIRCATTAAPDVSVPRVAVRGEVVRVEPQPDGRWGLDGRFTRYRFLEGAPVLGPPGRGPGAVCRPPERTRDMSSREVDRINRVQGPIQAACTLLMPHTYSRRPPSRTWGSHCAWDTACYGVGMTVATPHPPVSPVWDAGAGAAAAAVAACTAERQAVQAVRSCWHAVCHAAENTTGGDPVLENEEGTHILLKTAIEIPRLNFHKLPYILPRPFRPTAGVGLDWCTPCATK
jgi:hypothetical protein